MKDHPRLVALSVALPANFLNSLQSYELIRLLANYSDNFFQLLALFFGIIFYPRF